MFKDKKKIGLPLCLYVFMQKVLFAV